MTKTTREMIEVMEAYERGEEIEVKYRGAPGCWAPTESPGWNWDMKDYRIAVTPDTINWDHVAPEYKWMARDNNGCVYFYKNRPTVDNPTGYWNAEDEELIRAESHSSYKRGTCDWKDSLVERPSQ